MACNDNVFSLPPPPPSASAEQHADAETKRRNDQNAWADQVLHRIGLASRIAYARSLNELHRVVFPGKDDPGIGLAINDALNPAVGKRADYLKGLNAGILRGLLRNRFNDMKRDREKQLLGGHGGQRAQPEWMDDIKYNPKTGEILGIVHNYMLYLSNHLAWVGTIGFDTFANRTVLLKSLPEGKEKAGTRWNDLHETQTRRWFQAENIKAVKGEMGSAVQAVAHNNEYHPVRDYFEGLQQGGASCLLDTWLIDFCHCEDTEYVRAVGARALIAVAARIYQPGCQADTVLILEGPQGWFKSKALRTLAIKREWFSDRLSHLGSKDAIIDLHGKLIIEIAELDAIVRIASSTAKGFITRPVDTYRPPYGKHSIDIPRQSSLFGSINPPPEGYMKDTTGNRRYLPATCRDKVDVDGLMRDLDPLWAEAVARFKAGAPWWMETEHLEALATAEQKLRYETDPWTKPIKNWIGERLDVSSHEVMVGALGIDPKQDAGVKSAEARIVPILKMLGFEHYTPNIDGHRPNRYRRRKT